MILLPSEVSCRSLFYWIKKYKYVLAASGIRPKESLELMILILFNLWIMGTRALHSAMYADWCPISQLISIHTVQQHSISYRFINAHCAHCDAVSFPAVVTPSRRRQEGRTSPSPKTQLLATRIELDARQSEAKQNMKKKNQIPFHRNRSDGGVHSCSAIVRMLMSLCVVDRSTYVQV